MARVRLLEKEEVAEPIRRRLEEIASSRGRVFNLYKLLANSPIGVGQLYGLVAALWAESELSRDVQELVILRVAQLSGSRYEWARHRHLARGAGISDEQIEALSAWPTSGAFDDRLRAVLAVVDAAVQRRPAGDQDFSRLKRFMSDRQVLELVALAGFYVMLAIVIGTLELDPEEGDEARMSGFAPTDAGHDSIA